MPPFLLHQKFLETTRKFPQKTAIRIKESASEYKSYTYSELLRLATAAGFYFIRQGIKRQDKVAIILENRPAWPIFYFGVLFAGATAVPIDIQLTESEVRNILADCGAKLVITKINADEILNNLIDAPAGYNFPHTEIEDTASLLYTSGTTAEPKAVELSHRNFSANIESIKGLHICTETDTMLSILPLHHSYPFTVTLLLPLCVGAGVVYIKTLKPEEIASAMRDAGVTILVGVPQLFYLFHKGIFEKIKETALPLFFIRPFAAKMLHTNFGDKLRFFASGGARLEPKIAKDLAYLGITILEGYGLTETSPIVTFNPLEKQKFGSVGTPIPGVKIRILDPDKDGTGEVLIQGPNVMKGYYKKQAETDAVIKEGWFYSGDLGYIDNDGYLFITGRKKEVIVLSSGKNIYPEEIEAHYQKSPFIKELCVLSEMEAVIVPDMEYFKKIGEINIREKIKWELETLSKDLPFYKRILGFTVATEAIPRTRLGKIKRYEVEERYAGQFKKEKPVTGDPEPKQEDLEILNSEIGKKITEFLAKVRNIKRAIRGDDHLELDLGIDSLGRVELAVGLEKIFNIDIPEARMAGIFTVRDIIANITELLLKKSSKAGGAYATSADAMWKLLLMKDPPQAIKSKIDLSPNIFSKITALIMTGFLFTIFKLFFKLKVEGRKNIPKNGPFILCPNHSSYLDAFIVAASVPYNCELNLFFLGFREYFYQPVIRNLIKLMRVVPIDPAAELINAMQASSFIVKNKKSLCIFPEGQRSIDGRPKAFKKGVGIFAAELGVPLIPVAIKGSFESWPRAKAFPHPHPIKVVFGKALYYEGSDYEAIAAGLRIEVLDLMAKAG